MLSALQAGITAGQLCSPAHQDTLRQVPWPPQAHLRPPPPSLPCAVPMPSLPPAAPSAAACRVAKAACWHQACRTCCLTGEHQVAAKHTASALSLRSDTIIVSTSKARPMSPTASDEQCIDIWL